MKLKITDVKSFIKEILPERSNEYSFQRNEYKFPTDEDQARIQREFGMTIDFSVCMDGGNFLDRCWYKDFEILGILIIDVYSTMDDDYAIIIASVKPGKYMAMAYGPRELIKSFK